MRRRNCKKFDSYTWMGQVKITVYFNRPENRFEAEVDGKEFFNTDIQTLRKEIDTFLSGVDRTQWDLYLLVGRRHGYDYDLAYKAPDGTIRQADFPDGLEEAIKTRTMPKVGPIRSYTKVDEAAIPFTWEYLEAARAMKKRLEYLKECITELSESKEQRKILDAFLADKIAIPERPVVTTDEIGPEDSELMNLLNEIFDFEMEDY